MPRPTLKSRVRLGAAVLVLAALTIAMFLTSTPERSPARTWATWAWELRYRVVPLEDESELAELHANAATRSREECVACHGDKRDSKLSVHRIHLTSEMLSNLSCHECHQRVELASRGATTGVTWVDVGFCKACHSAFPGLDPESHMRGEDIDADCTMCHTGARAVRHAQPYLPQIVPSSECRGCHGGRVLPWTPRHEGENWLAVHGAEALDMGTEHCFECHDFGLKFCDECHAEEPPSHFPEDRWRDHHPEAARTDTRMCYTCHETSFCKGCHVNHEAGWRTTHPAFVDERGSSSCTECHSLSSCSFCHTAEAMSGGSTQTTAQP